MKLYATILGIFIALSSSAQVGFWTEHLPYYQTIDLASGGETKVFTATPYGVFAFNYDDSSIERFTKASGLSDVGISAIEYSLELGILVVGYSSGNLDLVFNSGSVNMPDIAESSILADKGVREIVVRGDKAYLACGFGVVVIDMLKREVSDTWFLGSDGIYLGVNDVLFDDTYVYAATEAGIFRADVDNVFLADFQSWDLLMDTPEPMGNYVNLELNSLYMVAQTDNGDEDAVYVKTLADDSWAVLDGISAEWVRDVHITEDRIFVSTYGNLRFYNMDLVSTGAWGEIAGVPIRGNAIEYASSSRIWVANDENGLLGFNFFGGAWNILPDGPKRADVRKVEAWNNNVWICQGGVDASWVNNYNADGVFGLVDDQWIWEDAVDELRYFDIMDASINPLDPSEVYFGSFFHGLIRMKDGVFTDQFTPDNSSLSPSTFGGTDRVGVGGLDFDLDGNLWFSNTNSATPMHVRTPDGEFHTLNVGGLLDEGNRLTEVLATSSGYIWCMIPDQTGIVVINPNETPGDTSDDSFVLLDGQEGSGGLPSEDVFCMEEDLDGEIWVGLLEGLAVFYSQDCLFDGGENCDAQQILITQDGNVQILLETETVNAIEIDGANRKWIGTAGSGAYLLSEDGTRQIQHFTADNSPLLSNNVFDIAINHENGEVVFGTEKGVISFRGDATNFYPEMEEVTVFPNPVEPGFAGDIIIDGLAQDADVKIADIAGNVVFETRANGGRAVWDGKRLSGEAVATGVYLVFITTIDGVSTEVSKVAVIR